MLKGEGGNSDSGSSPRTRRTQTIEVCRQTRGIAEERRLKKKVVRIRRFQKSAIIDASIGEGNELVGRKRQKSGKKKYPSILEI